MGVVTLFLKIKLLFFIYFGRGHIDWPITNFFETLGGVFFFPQ
jgi:hypothetical protein